MPLYEYKCNQCGSQFDLLVGVGNRKAVLKCPQCGSKDLKKEFSVFGTKISTEPQSPTAASGCSSCTASSCQGCSIK